MEVIRSAGNFTESMKLKDIIAQLLQPYDRELMMSMVEKWILPNFEPYINMIPSDIWKIARPMLRAEYLRLKGEGRIDYDHFFTEVCSYRPDISEFVLINDRCAKWFKLFHRHITNFMERL
jgi:hypothetical protein